MSIHPLTLHQRYQKLHKLVTTTENQFQNHQRKEFPRNACLLSLVYFFLSGLTEARTGSHNPSIFGTIDGHKLKPPRSSSREPDHATGGQISKDTRTFSVERIFHRKPLFKLHGSTVKLVLVILRDFPGRSNTKSVAI